MKPKIKVIERRFAFYKDDMDSIRKKEDDWGDLEVLEDLTENCSDDVNEDEVEVSAKDVFICWNAKEDLVEILDYKYQY